MMTISQKMNEMTIRRANSVMVASEPNGATRIDDATMMTLQVKLAQSGYVLSDQAMTEVSRLSPNKFNRFYADLTVAVESLSGNSRKNKRSFFPNFPKEVMEASDVYLYSTAMIHYLGMSFFGERFVPAIQDERMEVSESEFRQAKVLSVETRSVAEIAADILGSSLSISGEDDNDLTTLDNHNDWSTTALVEALDTRIDLTQMNRENLVRVLVKVREESGEDHATFEASFEKLAKTATDVLRYAVARSGGEASLIGNALDGQFKSFARWERRLFFRVFDRMSYDTLAGDMLRNVSLWKRFARVLHPSDLLKGVTAKGGIINGKTIKDASEVSSTYCAFHDLAHNSLPASFAGEFDKLVSKRDVRALVDFVKARPGEFARRLNVVLSLGDKREQSYVVAEFQKVADKISPVILWQMLPLFRYRNTDKTRVVVPKGAISNNRILPMPKKAYSEKVANSVVEVIFEGLVKQYAGKGDLGKVWVDPNLASYTVPTGVRNASKSANAIGRGSRIKCDDLPVQRFFLWWKDNEHRTDYDLSAVKYDEDFVNLGAVAYYNLRDRDTIVHSGDFTRAPNGAAEYIDVNLDRLIESGDSVRYIALTVHVYNGDNFSEVECYAGVMGRDKALTNDTEFDARTVSHHFDVNANARDVVPLIIDVKERKIIWADYAGKAGSTIAINNARTTAGATRNTVQAAVEKRHSNLLELFMSHALARGTVTEDRDEADTVFEVANGVPNITMDEILTSYL